MAYTSTVTHATSSREQMIRALGVGVARSCLRCLTVWLVGAGKVEPSVLCLTSRYIRLTGGEGNPARIERLEIVEIAVQFFYVLLAS